VSCCTVLAELWNLPGILCHISSRARRPLSFCCTASARSAILFWLPGSSRSLFTVCASLGFWLARVRHPSLNEHSPPQPNAKGKVTVLSFHPDRFFQPWHYSIVESFDWFSFLFYLLSDFRYVTFSFLLVFGRLLLETRCLLAFVFCASRKRLSIIFLTPWDSAWRNGGHMLRRTASAPLFCDPRSG